MPYVTKEREVTEQREQFLGFDEITSIRPNLVYFEFTGLRPSTPHWFFFDGVEVTKWINTSYTFTDYNDNTRNSKLRNPGDAYLNATAFPDQLGGPTASSGPINSDATGKIEGMFYIQSNATTSFPTGTRILNVIDVSVLNKDNSLSFAAAEYKAVGEYELFYNYDYTYTETYEEWVDPPPPTPPANSGSNNDDDPPVLPSFSYEIDGTFYNVYGDDNVTTEDEYLAAAYGDNVIDRRDTSSSSSSSNDDGGSSGGGGGGNSKVLCYLAYRNGLLDEKIYQLDEKFGEYVEAEHPDVMNGYHSWAMPMVHWIDEGSWLSKQYLRFWVAPLTRSWGTHIAHLMEPENYKYNLWGHTVFTVGTVGSRLVGKYLRWRNQNKVKV